jgi:hypothetical protein
MTNFLCFGEHLAEARAANNIKRLERLGDVARMRRDEAASLGWPALAASWEADVQRAQSLLKELKG